MNCLQLVYRRLSLKSLAKTDWIYGYLSYFNSMQDSTREIQKVWRFFLSSEIADTDLSGITVRYERFEPEVTF
jgi:hypothetical protein